MCMKSHDVCVPVYRNFFFDVVLFLAGGQDLLDRYGSAMPSGSEDFAKLTFADHRPHLKLGHVYLLDEVEN